jgi:hypothetical protein
MQFCNARLLAHAAIFSTLLLPGIALSQDRFHEGRPYDAASVNGLVDRVHADLDHAYSAFHFSNGDRDRLNHSEKELRDFSKKWFEHHHFDKDELDDVIGSIQHVFDNNRLPEDSRAALSDDLSQLRAMRSAYDRHEIRE